MAYGILQGIQSTQERIQHVSQSGSGGRAGSTADLFPKLVVMQRLCNSDAFAVLIAQAQSLLTAGRLECHMQSPASEATVDQLLEAQSAFLLSHLGLSPRPVIFAPHTGPAQEASPGLTVPVPVNSGIDLAFPAQLGAMGNGYVIFFSVRAAINNDLLIDLHRKSLTVIREKLRLSFGGATQSDKLNEREIECLQLVGNGMKSEAIGERLTLSVHTVNAYLGSATTKLNAVNRIQAIAKAIRLGIIA
ncbi:LuxR C-terminal-related transcriptional regulator [Hoeflea sp.]|uniref:response regulator transcription factor n=1 Tax=Hoeflea sp. TaxID=1940281 RepID=UPI00198ACFAD|nr:LuxR C-terminal-related transcriptional regulator [Hoeflea sp.]MBC7284385.1 helix-turn-helix transcriptional regulator [Hoeflea sp.]